MAITVTPEQQSRLSHSPISQIKAGLDRLFGTDWKNWEPETISMEFGIEFDPLLLDKIAVLQVLAIQPDMFYVDPIFMVHSTDAMNNNEVDFDVVPLPSSLELGFAITQVTKVTGSAPRPDDPITKTLAYMLRQEGYSEPLAPFDFIPKELLEAGQTSSDTAAKKDAMKKYIAYMDTL